MTQHPRASAAPHAASRVPQPTARATGPAAIFFDLDGTLIDSAPDLAAAANLMRSVRGLPAMPYEQLRPMAGSGARGMLSRAFGLAPGDADYLALRDEFHDRYETLMLASTHAFAGVEPLLVRIQAQGLAWGIVTNKSRRFAGPVVEALPVLRGAGTLVCGDCTPHTKPHPAPLLEAARRLALEPSHCIYVGDDRRDIEAGHAAGMATVAAAWGYLGPNTSAHEWNAGHVIASPIELLQYLDLA